MYWRKIMQIVFLIHLLFVGINGQNLNWPGDEMFSCKLFHNKIESMQFFDHFLLAYLQFYGLHRISIIADHDFRDEVPTGGLFRRALTSVQFLTEKHSLGDELEKMIENLQLEQPLILILSTNSSRIGELEFLPRQFYRRLPMLVVEPSGCVDFSPRLPLDNRVSLVKTVHGRGNSSFFELWETYSVPHRETIAKSNVGNWLPSGYLDAPSKEVTSRRMDLLGTTLNCISEMEGTENGILLAEDGSWEPYGWHFETNLILQDFLNYSCRWSVSPDRHWGTAQEDGPWTGMVGELIAGQADIVIANLDNIPARAEVIDFLFPETVNGFAVVVRAPNQLGSMWQIYLTELTPLAWTFTVGFFFVYSLLYFFTVNSDPLKRGEMNLVESFLFVWGAFAGQGYHKVTTSISGRIVFIHVFLLAMLISAHYTSWLYSMLTVSKIIYPFDGIKSILDDGSYSFGAVDGYSVLTAMRVSDDPLMKSVLKNIQENDGIVKDSAQGFTKVMESDYAFINSKILIEDNINNYDMIRVTDYFFSYGTGKAVAKNSAIKDVFNAAILRLYISGALDKLKRDWKEETLEKDSQTKNAITLEQIISVLALVLVMVGLSLILLLLEFLWAKKFKDSTVGS